MNEQQWLEWRRGGVGASDVAAAITDKYGGMYRIVGDKHGLTEQSIDPDDARRGHEWEQAIVDGVHALTGWYVAGEQLWVSSPQNSVWRATIDGLLAPTPTTTIDEAAAVLEVKTSRQHVHPKWDYYNAQTQWQMLVCGKQRALVALAVIALDLDGNETVHDLHLRWIERDDYLITDLVEISERIWRHVRAGTMPEPDEATRIADVRAVNRHAEPEATVDIDDLVPLIAEMQSSREIMKVHSENAALLEAKIRHRMGEATEAVTTDGHYRVRVGQPVQRFTRDSEDAALLLHSDYGKTVLDRARFKQDHPAIYDELKAPTTDRRLTIKEFDPE